jgi:2-polyprenyl-3-methyl-5-hydroxy-6-metoxy-1,4-benzoquinol methylase
MPPRTAVLEIGCGPGQLAQLLADRGVAKYLGFDFSREAIQMARKRCPSLEFQVADGLTTDSFKTADYEIVICTEVLEHVQADLELLSRIKPGSRCIMTVPNFPYVSHVRHFVSYSDVTARYGSLFSGLRVDWLLMNEQGAGFFLLDGIRTSHDVISKSL